MSNGYEQHSTLPEIIGYGGSGLTYKYIYGDTTYAATLWPRHYPNNEFDLARELGESTNSGTQTPLELGFVLPSNQINICNNQQRLLLQSALQEVTMEQLLKAETILRNKGIDFLENPVEACLTITQNDHLRRELGQIVGEESPLILDPLLHEFAKLRARSDLYLYPFIPDLKGSLKEWIIKLPSTPKLDLTESWMSWLAEKIDLLSSLGWSHGDLGSGNIFMTKDDRLFLADFEYCKKNNNRNRELDREGFINLLRYLLSITELKKYIQEITSAVPSLQGIPGVESQLLAKAAAGLNIANTLTHNGIYNIERNRQAAVTDQALMKLGLTQKTMLFVYNFKHTKMSHEELVRQVFTEIRQNSTTTPMKAQRKKRGRRKRK